MILSASASAQTVEIRLTETGMPSLWPISLPLMAQVQASTITEQIPAAPSQSLDSNVQGLVMDAEWLNAVKQRIISSTATEGYELKGNTAWLQPEVARAALDFFRQTSKVLPSEPYIYSSLAGDLVAEFSAPRGKMTCLVSPQFVLVFAAAGGEIMQKEFLPKEESADTLRSGIQAVTNFLGAGPNGAVESRL